MDLVSITNELIEKVSIDNTGHIDQKIESIKNLNANRGDETILRN